MRSPAQMKIIMIDVTNACHKACSNCTRFCGEHAKSFFMDVDYFKKAVDSLEGFEGIVGMIGGEPTLHPHFEEMARYLAERIPERRAGAFFGDPTPNFQHYSRMVKYMRGRRRGLFSSLGAGYYRNFEVIQDLFPYQSLNDHRSVNTHQAILVTRKELGIGDEEWLKLRDNCWIQNLWSATITPKGAFFCEIAASLDMLFDGPGGWPVEPGWWKRQPHEFGEQLEWCESCSVALPVPTMEANAETDIVSPSMLERLRKVNGPKVRNNKFVVLEPADYDKNKYGHKADPIWYLPPEQGDLARIAPTNEALLPHRIDVATLEGAHALSTLTREQAENLEFKDWIAVFRRAEDVNEEFLAAAQRCVLNPGCLYRQGRDVWLLNRRAFALRRAKNIEFDHTVPSLWMKRKQIKLRNYPRIDHPGWRLRCRLRLQQLLHRIAFIMPPWIDDAAGRRASTEDNE